MATPPQIWELQRQVHSLSNQVKGLEQLVEDLTPLVIGTALVAWGIALQFRFNCSCPPGDVTWDTSCSWCKGYPNE